MNFNFFLSTSKLFFAIFCYKHDRVLTVYFLPLFSVYYIMYYYVYIVVGVLCMEVEWFLLIDSLNSFEQILLLDSKYTIFWTWLYLSYSVYDLLDLVVLDSLEYICWTRSNGSISLLAELVSKISIGRWAQFNYLYQSLLITTRPKNFGCVFEIDPTISIL